MSEARTFCPECGDPLAAGEALARPDRDAPGRTGICRSCFFERFDLVSLPEEVTVRVCTQCGAVHRGNQWVDVGAKDYTDVAIEEVADAIAVHRAAEAVDWGVEPRQQDPNTIRLLVGVRGLVHDEPLTEEQEVTVRIARETCRRCGRIAGSSFAGTIQVRGSNREPTHEETDRAIAIAHEVVDELTAAGNRDAFVTEVVERPEGVDIRVSTTNIGAKVANQLTREFGGAYETSETLVTEDGDGQGVYRVTYAVRLPQFTPGDIIDPGDGDGAVLVQRSMNHVKGRRLATGERFEHAEAPDESFSLVGHLDDAKETTLVTVEDDHAIQVLDPDSYEPKTIPRPPDVDVTGAEVQVVRADRGLFALPASITTDEIDG